MFLQAVLSRFSAAINFLKTLLFYCVFAQLVYSSVICHIISLLCYATRLSQHYFSLVLIAPGSLLLCKIFSRRLTWFVYDNWVMLDKFQYKATAGDWTNPSKITINSCKATDLNKLKPVVTFNNFYQIIMQPMWSFSPFTPKTKHPQYYYFKILLCSGLCLM